MTKTPEQHVEEMLCGYVPDRRKRAKYVARICARLREHGLLVAGDLPDETITPEDRASGMYPESEMTYGPGAMQEAYVQGWRDALAAARVAPAAQEAIDRHMRSVAGRVIEVFEKADGDDLASDVMQDVLAAIGILEAFGAAPVTQSPDREKLESLLRDARVVKLAEPTFYKDEPVAWVNTPLTALLDLLDSAAFALAVPSVVNEAKLAEVIARAMPGWNDDTTEPGLDPSIREMYEGHWERVNAECIRQGREYARVAVERQREWLG